MPKRNPYKQCDLLYCTCTYCLNCSMGCNAHDCECNDCIWTSNIEVVPPRDYSNILIFAAAVAITLSALVLARFLFN